MTKQDLDDRIKIGRPAKYNPLICDDLIGARRDGCSITRACVKLGISKDTYFRWIKEYPEFKEAADHAKDCAEAYWEDTLHDAALKKTEVNDKLLKYAIDRQCGPVIDPTKTEKTQINIENMNVLQNLTDEELKAKVLNLNQRLKALNAIPSNTDDYDGPPETA